MRGSIIKRYPGSWSLIIPLGKDLTSGKYKQLWVTFKGNKHEAEKKLNELIHQRETGSLVRPGRMTCADFLVRWLEESAKLNLAPRSFERYQDIVKQYLIPDFKDLRLIDLRPEHIQAHYRRCYEAHLSNSTIQLHHDVIHKALDTAVEWGLVIRNVADAVKPPKRQHKEMATWDEDEMRQFLDAARETPYYAIFYTALFTGMRRSELLGLQWQDIDLLGLQISVSRGLHYLRDGSIVIRDVKSKKSRRTIAMTPSLATVLRTISKGKKSKDFVFSRKDGKPLHRSTIGGAWNAIIKKAGVKHIRFHDARHTHATLLFKQGIHPKIVQERLGHASIQMTLDTYSHVVPGLQEAAAKGFDELLHTDTERAVS